MQLFAAIHLHDITVMQTCHFALRMSAFDPKRTLAGLELHPFRSTTAG